MCIRKWIFEYGIQDPALAAELQIGDCNSPLPLGNFEMNVDAEFRSTLVDPVRGPATPPFQITPVLHSDGLTVSVDAKETVLPGVEVRILSTGVRPPELTMAAESKLMHEVLEKFYGFNVHDLENMPK
jgi:hypothetical protein